ncbi:hypothetical protein PXK56_18280 [Phaeobacter gallaeciensis]|uniref:hypothetical protein n=1 Tax=Phaeobacter gallaeciensis TaxID=60890 RepID=UPI002380AA2C|nr:hypothetical protein [Phaeobacter gallaeciensis]MDE4297135.1 hypothetical protein [Phaeobacter gallaeciensis]
MRNLVLVLALTGLAACASPEGMYYEVTQRGADTVSIQANVGNMNRQSPVFAQMMTHMDGMAVEECRGAGKKEARVTNEWTRTAGPYHTWVERSYACS